MAPLVAYQWPHKGGYRNAIGQHVFFAPSFFYPSTIFLPVHIRFYPSKWRVDGSLHKATDTIFYDASFLLVISHLHQQSLGHVPLLTDLTTQLLSTDIPRCCSKTAFTALMSCCFHSCSSSKVGSGMLFALSCWDMFSSPMSVSAAVTTLLWVDSFKGLILFSPLDASSEVVHLLLPVAHSRRPPFCLAFACSSTTSSLSLVSFKLILLFLHIIKEAQSRWM